MTSGLPSDWSGLTADHAAALEQFVAAVRNLPPASWNRPLAPGKWTPAEVSSHLTASYRIMRAELAGGPGMALRLPRLQRWLLRHTILPRILRGRPFPEGARAPRETRPREIMEDVSNAVRTLVQEADALVDELAARARASPVSFTHAYFGSLSARQGMQLLAAHARHHARQLADLR